MGWDEIFHPNLPNNIMIQSWRGMESLSAIADAGYQGLLSTGFYIDQPQATSFHYRNDPLRQWEDQAIELEGSDEVEAWEFTMPRLKGSAVSGHLVVIKRNHALAHAYLKLNNNHYQKVTLDNHLSFNESQINVALDSWMGPLTGQFELNEDQSLSGRMLIGNTHYGVQGHRSEDFDYNELSILPKISARAKKNILGGEATLWTELVSKDTIDNRAWPRLFAIAERLWSSPSRVDVDDMYVRLEKMNQFADVIGLRHLAQQREGFASLLTSKASIDPLLILAEQLEPAAYYTRHHIKYQNGLYHQRAPLDQFADFLPVESFPLIRLHRQLDAFANGDEKALMVVIATQREWQANFQELTRLIQHNPRLSSLAPLVADARTINSLGLSLAEGCSQGLKLSEKQAKETKGTLKSLHREVREVSLASGLLVERVLALCLYSF